MQRNMGNTERIIRIIIGVTLLSIVYANTLSGWWKFIASIVGVLELVSAFFAYCIVYELIGWSPYKNIKSKQSST